MGQMPTDKEIAKCIIETAQAAQDLHDLQIADLRQQLAEAITEIGKWGTKCGAAQQKTEDNKGQAEKIAELAKAEIAHRDAHIKALREALKYCLATLEDDVVPARNTDSQYRDEAISIATAVLTDTEPASPWVSVEDRLPEEVETPTIDDLVLACDDGDIQICFYDGDWDCPDKGYLNKKGVTHWMPIPPLPEKE